MAERLSELRRRDPLLHACGLATVGPPEGGPGLPLTHGSTRGGDLRVAHVIALHALQRLTLAGWWLARRAGEDPSRQARTSRKVQLLAPCGSRSASARGRLRCSVVRSCAHEPACEPRH